MGCKQGTPHVTIVFGADGRYGRKKTTEVAVIVRHDPVDMGPDSQIAQSATLIIVGEDLDPLEVTNKMGLQPSHAWSKGDRKSYLLRDGTRGQFKSIHDGGGWKVFLPEDHKNQELIDQLRYWVETLRSRSASLQHFRGRGFTVELNCCLVGDGTLGIRIPVDIQKDLASFGVDLDITFYAHRADDSAA